jgi:hypothetical protein
MLNFTLLLTVSWGSTSLGAARSHSRTAPCLCSQRSPSVGVHGGRAFGKWLDRRNAKEPLPLSLPGQHHATGWANGI